MLISIMNYRKLKSLGVSLTLHKSLLYVSNVWWSVGASLEASHTLLYCLTVGAGREWLPASLRLSLVCQLVIMWTQYGSLGTHWVLGVFREVELAHVF